MNTDHAASDKVSEWSAAHCGHLRGLLHSWNFWIALVLVLAAVYRLWKLNTLPTGYNNDEMGTAYDAWSLLNYGVDRYRNSWPVYMTNYGDGQSILYCYMMVACFAVFGYCKLAIRLPGVINSLLLGVCGVGVIGLAWKDRYGVRREVPQLLFAVLFAISPYLQMSARIGLDCNAMLGWSTAFLYTFLLAVRKSEQRARRRVLHYVLCGVVGGITLYSYALTYLVVPLFLILSLIYLLLCRKICRMRTEKPLAAATASNESRKQLPPEDSRAVSKGTVSIAEIAAFVIPLVLLAVPLILVQYVNFAGADSFRLFGIFTVTRLGNYRSGEFTLSNLWNDLYLTIRAAIFHDGLDYNTSEQFWTFYPVSVPFFFIGLVVSAVRVGGSLKQRHFDPYVIPFIWFCAQLFVCCMLGEKDSGANPNANKVNGIYFTVMLFIVTGVVFCFRDLIRFRWKKAAAGVVCVLYLILFVQFTQYYFGEYRPTRYWRDTFEDVLVFIEEDPILSQKETMILTNWMDTNYIYLLNSYLPSPYEVNVADKDFGKYHPDLWNFDTELNETYGYGANYLAYQCTDEMKELFKEKNFEIIEFGNYTLFCYR